MENREKLLARNVKIFFIEKIFEWLWSFWAVIIVIFQMQELWLSFSQVLLWESVFAATILLSEILTWIFADKFWRKKSMIYWFWFAMAFYNLIASWISYFWHEIIKKLWEIQSLFLILLILSCTFCVISFIDFSILLAVTIPWMFQISRTLMPIVRDDIVNTITYSHHRATVMSIQSFLVQWFQMLFLPVFWYFVDLYSLLTMYLILWVFILIFGWYFIWKLKLLYNNWYKHG